jgi:phosphoribosylglycinamide formyltransferase 1
MEKSINIGVLVSGGGTNLQAIIDACEAGKIDGQVVFVGSDNPDVYGLERAKKHNIPTFVVDYKKIIHNDQAYTQYKLPNDVDLGYLICEQKIFKNFSAEITDKLLKRVIAETALLNEMSAYQFDLVVLAGFMSLFTPYFINKISSDPLNPKIMNIHPALLPAFPGTDGYGDTFRYGCKVGGCTVHFVDNGPEDSGPIIGQKVYEINEDDTIDAIKVKGLANEWQLFPECIQLYAKGRLKVIEKEHDLGKKGVFRRRIVKMLSKEEVENDTSV